MVGFIKVIIALLLLFAFMGAVKEFQEAYPPIEETK